MTCKKSRGRDAYKRFIEEQRAEGTYFDTYRAHTRFLALDEAALLDHLINVGKVHADDDGFYLCTTSFLQDWEDGLNLDPAEQKRLLGQLERRGLIEIEQREGSRPGRWQRYIRVKLPRVAKAVANGEGRPKAFAGLF